MTEPLMSITFRMLSAGLALASLSACVVTEVIEADSFDSVATGHYSHYSAAARKAQILDEDCRWPCYRMGDGASIGYFPPRLSARVKAAGPIFPVIPMPGEGTSYGEESFFIGLQVRPGLRSLLILEPAEYRLQLKGHPEPLAPVKAMSCQGNEVSMSGLAVFGSPRCFILVFDVARGEVQDFVLQPAIVEVDEISYMFPDVEWTRGTYSWAE